MRNIAISGTVGKLSEKCWETLDVKVGGGSVEKHYFVSCQRNPNAQEYLKRLSSGVPETETRNNPKLGNV